MAKKEKNFWPIEGVTRNEVLKSQNDNRFNAIRTRKARRAIILSISILTLVMWLSPSFPGEVPTLVELLGGLLLLIGYLVIRTSVRHIADSPDELLDERQIALRDRSYLHSYRILSTLILTGLIALFVRVDLSESEFDISGAWGTGSLLALIFLMGGLPSMVLGWLDKGEDEV